MIALAAPLCLAEPVSAPVKTGVSQPLGQGFGKPGNVTIDARQSIANPGSVTFTGHAHLVTENGATLDAAELKALISKEDNTFQKVIATGKVKGTFNQAITKRFYTVYADEGVYDPKKNQIDLTGSVRILIDSPMTKGPLVQTGTSAVVLLGNGPDYPIITTQDVKTVFTVNQ